MPGSVRQPASSSGAARLAIAGALALAAAAALGLVEARGSGASIVAWAELLGGGDATSRLRFWQEVTELGRGDCVALCLGLALVATRSRRLVQDGLFGVCAALVLCTILKLLVDRARPVSGEPFSWPSGHSVAVFALAFALAGAPRRARGAVFAAALVVAASRVVLLRHWPSDVCSGIAIACFCAALARRAPLVLPASLLSAKVKRWVAGLCVLGTIAGLALPLESETMRFAWLAPLVTWRLLRARCAPLRTPPEAYA